MKKVLVISFSNLITDARVKRQIGFLKNLGLEVTAAAYQVADTEINFIKISPPRLGLISKVKSGPLLLLRFYSKAYDLLYGQKLEIKDNFDLIIANDIEALPLAFRLKGDANILFDAHEYAPRHFEDKLSWRIFFQGFNTFLCKKYIPQVDGMTTIGEGIANEYEKHFGVKPAIITNAPSFYDLNPQPVDNQKIKLVHQGIANPSRKLELMFEMMDHLDDRFHLDLMLMEPTFKSGIKYLQQLKTLAEKNRRISFVSAKSTSELIPALNQYDVGIVLIPPVNFNYKNTLPNKFFECVQARVALAIGPIPEIKKITEAYSIGVVSEDFDPISLARKINSLDAQQIELFKKNTAKVAREMNAEKNEIRFKESLQRMKILE
jgi:hypothetical protein